MSVAQHPIFGGPVRKPDRRTRVALRLEEWPEPDQAMWAAAVAAGDLFDEAAPGAHLRARTRASLMQAYGRWLGCLLQSEPAAMAQSPGARVTRDQVERYCAGLSQTNTPLSIASQVRHLRAALNLIAPVSDWSWLLVIAKQIEAQSRPRSKRHRLRLSDELYNLGRNLIDQAEAEISGTSRVGKAAALTFRDGLIIALLALAPVRRRNLQDLRIGETLVRAGAGWSVVFGEQETKSGRELDYPLPKDLSQLLDRYIADIRPALFGSGTHNGLWASVKGSALSGNALYAAVCRRTKAAFGEAVNLHLFRDAAATFLAVTAPEKVQVASDLLGHARQPTTQRHYTNARPIQASQRLADVIATMRVEHDSAKG